MASKPRAKLGQLQRAKLGILTSDVRQRAIKDWEEVYSDLALASWDLLGVIGGAQNNAYTAYEDGRYHDAAAHWACALEAGCELEVTHHKLQKLLLKQPAIDPSEDH